MCPFCRPLLPQLQISPANEIRSRDSLNRRWIVPSVVTIGTLSGHVSGPRDSPPNQRGRFPDVRGSAPPAGPNNTTNQPLRLALGAASAPPKPPLGEPRYGALLRRVVRRRIGRNRFAFPPNPRFQAGGPFSALRDVSRLAETLSSGLRLAGLAIASTLPEDQARFLRSGKGARTQRASRNRIRPRPRCSQAKAFWAKRPVDLGRVPGPKPDGPVLSWPSPLGRPTRVNPSRKGPRFGGTASINLIRKTS